MSATLIARDGGRHSFHALSTGRLLLLSRRPRDDSTGPRLSRPMSKKESTQPNRNDFEHLTAPTWSVHQLLSTYPAPKLKPELLTRLHKMSALKAPAEDSDAFRVLRGEMEELVRLVEAVKLVETTGISSDGRIWPIGRGVDLDSTRAKNELSTGEQDILRHAAKTINDYYIVDTPPSGRRK